MTGGLLVTGGSGLMGSALKKIIPNAVYLSRKDGDLTDLSQTRKIFAQTRPYHVIHLAAKVAGVKTNSEKNADMYMENVQINTNVLRVSQETGVKKLVTCLSNCVFKEKPESPPTEKDIYIGIPFHGHIGYGYSKRMLDLQIHLMKEQYGVNFTSITPVTVFGPHDNWNLSESHVAGSLIHKCYLAKKNRAPLAIWGGGDAVRQFVYAADVARILIEVLNKYDEPDTLIIAPEEGTTIRALVDAIVKAMDFKGPVQFDRSKPEGEKKRILNGGRFKTIFPDFRFTPFKEAVRETVQWFLDKVENQKEMEKMRL